jgi:hypothetical protein
MVMIFAFILYLLFSAQQNSVTSRSLPSWVDPEAIRTVRECWIETFEIWGDERVHEHFGLWGAHDAYICEFKYPTILGRINPRLSTDCTDLVECIEVQKGFSFRIYHLDTYLGDITVLTLGGEYTCTSRPAEKTPVKDPMKELYQDLGIANRRNVIVVGFSPTDYVHVIENNKYFAYYKYDFSKEKLISSDPFEYLDKLIESYADTIRIQRIEAYCDSLAAANDWEIPKWIKWKDAVAGGLVD